MRILKDILSRYITMRTLTQKCVDNTLLNSTGLEHDRSPIFADNHRNWTIRATTQPAVWCILLQGPLKLHCIRIRAAAVRTPNTDQVHCKLRLCHFHLIVQCCTAGTLKLHWTRTTLRRGALFINFHEKTQYQFEHFSCFFSVCANLVIRSIHQF